MRNAVKSRYGFATVMVGEGENSGAQIPAKRAVEHDRPVILLHSVVEATSWAPRLISRGGCPLRKVRQGASGSPRGHPAKRAGSSHEQDR